ncbi:C-type lectin isoform 3 [Aphelenchoides avenae]|nr:C-type lectin isoform 3 [Aphelenchus avenae]
MPLCRPAVAAIAFGPMNFEDAKTTCHYAGGHMVSISSPDVNDLLTELVVDSVSTVQDVDRQTDWLDHFWIGLYAVGDAPCRYQWLDNSSMSFENWQGGHAPVHCADITYRDNLWMNGRVASPRCVAVNFGCDLAAQLDGPCQGIITSWLHSRWEAFPCYRDVRAVCQAMPQTVSL